MLHAWIKHSAATTRESDSALRRKFQLCMQERTLSIRQPIMLCFKALVDQSVKTEAIKTVERLNIIQVKRNADVGWVSFNCVLPFRFELHTVR